MIDLAMEIRLAIAKLGGQKIVAFKMGISESDLSRKLNNERGWKLDELQNLFGLCELSISSGNNKKEDFDSFYAVTRKLYETMTELKELKGSTEEKQ